MQTNSVEESLEDSASDRCSAFGWDRVIYLYGSWYGTVFLICDGNGIDSTGLI